MGIMKIDPFRGFESIARKMNDFVNEFDKGFSLEYGGFVPRVDIFEDEKQISVQVEIAGVPKEEVKLTVNDENVLMIKGSKKREEQQKEKTYIRAERAFGEFSRSFLLPDNIDRETIQARFENGILFVDLQKKEPEKPKEIEVNIQ